MYCRDCLDRVAAALLIVRDVEQQVDVARIARVHDAGRALGWLAHAVHVVVIHERDADVGGPLAQVGQQPSHPLVVVGPQRLSLGRFVDHLKVLAAHRPHEAGVASCALPGLRSRMPGRAADSRSTAPPSSAGAAATVPSARPACRRT